MGRAPEMEVTPGTCVYVPTGGMIPEGADGVVMVICRLFSDIPEGQYTAGASTSNIVEAGDDMKEGQKVLEKGRRLRPRQSEPQQRLGITWFVHYCPWKITVISTEMNWWRLGAEARNRCGISTRMGSMRRPGGCRL